MTAFISRRIRLAPTEYLQRHDKADSYIHWSKYCAFRLPPKSISHQSLYKIMWLPHLEFQIRSIQINPPIYCKKKKSYVENSVIDVEARVDKNTYLQSLVKRRKCKDLVIEVRTMCHLNATLLFNMEVYGIITKRAKIWINFMEA